MKNSLKDKCQTICENLLNTDTLVLRGKFIALHSDFRREGRNQSFRYETHKARKSQTPRKQKTGKE